ncbi:MAG TPA: BlaI/MecI/CopY family transcriptional regulator [Longimicrobium sp.]
MAKVDLSALGERELDVMQVLWRSGESTVADVRRGLAARGVRVAYTTAQTILNRLEAKGVVARTSDDRAHVYRALAPQPRVVGSLIERLTDRFFMGSAEHLATHLVQSDLDEEELDRLLAVIQDRRARRNA